MTVSGLVHACDGERLSVLTGGGGGAVTAVVLHGAGTSSKERLRPLLGEFVAQGCRGLAFDFSGHGESTGRLRELSLRRRFEQAVSVIDARTPEAGPLLLVGFSMSGQTVADLVARYGERVRGVGLCAPAVYPPEAWELPFGDGTGPFTGIIRRPGGWRRSPALEALRAYGGRAVLAVPGTDAVIPPEVTAAVQDSLTSRADYTRFELPDASHQLGAWFRDRADDRREFVRALLGSGDRPAG